LGLNTAACLTAAFSRSYILSFVFGSFFDPLGLKLIKNYISESSFSQKFLYLASIILIHHFVLFSLEAFSFKFFSLIIYKTFLTSLLTLTFCTTTIYIMIKNEK
jgi:polyferredoxin